MSKALLGLLLSFLLASFTIAATEPEVLPVTVDVQNADLGIVSKSVILLEASTGTVIYEKNADEALSPASITKIMTLLLIFDALRDGKIALADEVTTSAYAKSMGGSQVYLEEGEKQNVETMIKCIVVASGNDASVSFKNGRHMKPYMVYTSRFGGMADASDSKSDDGNIIRVQVSLPAFLIFYEIRRFKVQSITLYTYTINVH